MADKYEMPLNKFQWHSFDLFENLSKNFSDLGQNIGDLSQNNDHLSQKNKHLSCNRSK